MNCNNNLDIDITSILIDYCEFYEQVYPEFYITNKLLPNTKLRPILDSYSQYIENLKFNEYTITNKNDIEKIKKSDNFISFNCALCHITEEQSITQYLYNTIEPKSGNILNLEYDYLKNVYNDANKEECYNLKYFILSKTIPIYFMGNGLLTSKDHYCNSCYYSEEKLFVEVMSILKNNKDIVCYHNNTLGSQPQHLHLHLSLDTKVKDYYIQEIKNNYDKTKLSLNIEGVNGFVFNPNEFVQKSYVLYSKNANILFNYTSKLYTFIKTEININYDLVSSSFCYNDNYFIVLFLYSKNNNLSIKLSPNSGYIKVDNMKLLNKLDNVKLYDYYNWEKLSISSELLQFRPNMKQYGEQSKIPMFSKFQYFNSIIINDKNKQELFSEKNILIMQYNKIKNLKNFKKRNYNHDFLIYIILLTLNQKYNSMDDYNIYSFEIKYRVKLHDINSNFSFIKGDAIVDLIKYTTKNNFFFDFIKIDKRVGESSASGQVYLSKYSDFGDTMIKFTLDKNDYIIEYQNGLIINSLRRTIPYYMYTYGKIECKDNNDTIEKLNDGSVRLINNHKFCNPDPNLPICDNNIIGKCIEKVYYTFVETIDNPISYYRFIKKINYKNINHQLQFFSIFLQLCISLYYGAKEIGFNHGDLHLDNILISDIKNNYLYNIKLDDIEIKIPILGYIPIIIDYGRSRTKYTENLVKEIHEKDTEKFIQSEIKYKKEKIYQKIMNKVQQEYIMIIKKGTYSKDEIVKELEILYKKMIKINYLDKQNEIENGIRNNIIERNDSFLNLYKFNQVSDIMTVILNIKLIQASKSFKSFIFDINSLINNILSNKIVLPEDNNLINSFLNEIVFYTGSLDGTKIYKANYSHPDQMGNENEYTQIRKNYPYEKTGLNLTSIMTLTGKYIEALKDEYDKLDFDATYNYGDFSSNILGPEEVKLDPYFKSKQNHLKNFMESLL